MENYSLSDIAAVSEGSGFGGGNSAWVLIILFALIFGWGGNGFGNRQGEFGQFATSASQSEILLGQKFDSLSRQINQVGDGLCSSTYALNNAINGVQTNLGAAVNSEGRAIQTQLAECCCTTQRNTDSLRFDMANYSAAIQANDTANTQKILDAISQNKIESLQGQINQLQLQNAMNGVVRYPNAWTYTAGASPFCGCNTCGCGTI